MNEIVDQDAMGEGKIINYLSIIVFFFLLRKWFFSTIITTL